MVIKRWLMLLAAAGLIGFGPAQSQAQAEEEGDGAQEQEQGVDWEKKLKELEDAVTELKDIAELFERSDIEKDIDRIHKEVDEILRKGAEKEGVFDEKGRLVRSENPYGFSEIRTFLKGRLRVYRKRELAKQEAFRGEITREKNRLQERRPNETVVVDEQTYEVIEPLTMEEAIGRTKVFDTWGESSLDFDFRPHDIWEISKDDLRIIHDPIEVVVPYVRQVVLGPPEENVPPEVIYRGDVKFLVPFTITNTTARSRRFGLRVWIVTDKLRFTSESGGWLHRETLDDSLLRFSTGGFRSRWRDSLDMIGYLRKAADGTSKVENAVEPGETRYGVATFPRFDQEMDKMRIVFEGVSNAFKYGQKLKRVLTFHYERPGDEFYPHQDTLRFVKKEWEWMWMWWSELAIDADTPPSKLEITTPAGVEKTMWYFRLTLTNSTKTPRHIDLRSFNRVLNLDLEVNGLKLKDVAVEIVDDGESTIHKFQVMREIGAEADFEPDRLFKGTLEPGEATSMLIILDESDVDFDKLHEQIEQRMNLATGDPKYDRKLLGIDFVDRALNMGDDWIRGLGGTNEQLRADVRRSRQVLDDKQKKQIREQVFARIGEKLEQDLDRKRVRASVTARAGLSTGTFTINRYYIRPGVVDEDWIHHWEDVEQE